jgi:hypothetical protein
MPKSGIRNAYNCLRQDWSAFICVALFLCLCSSVCLGVGGMCVLASPAAGGGLVPHKKGSQCQLSNECGVTCCSVLPCMQVALYCSVQHFKQLVAPAGCTEGADKEPHTVTAPREASI